ncbi:MAG TPA: ATP-binding cassette domain-containing protein [Acidobacteriaceae bacterium]|nr:ATP-binding cassette domain-containing protein [Acidobacteriaceae bacterium]
MGASPYVLECIHLSRRTPGGMVLLEDVNFSLAAGEILAITGPSGAGKSSLLRLLNRLDEPTAGKVLLHGQDYRELPPQRLRRHVGVVMQRAFLFPGTVASNVAFGPAQAGFQISSRAIEDLLAQVGLPGYASRNVANLSGGEAQRVAILRSLANDPELLLLDEPTSALDEVSKSAVENVLVSLIRRRKLSCVWVTHDDRQARRLAARMLVLQQGRVQALHPCMGERD